MTASEQIVRHILENYAGVYYVVPPDAHAKRERLIQDAARTAEQFMPKTEPALIVKTEP